MLCSSSEVGEYLEVQPPISSTKADTAILVDGEESGIKPDPPKY